MGFTGFYWVLLGFTGFYWVLLGFTGFGVVEKGFTWLPLNQLLVLLGFTGFQRTWPASFFNWFSFFFFPSDRSCAAGGAVTNKDTRLLAIGYTHTQRHSHTVHTRVVGFSSWMGRFFSLFFLGAFPSFPSFPKKKKQIEKTVRGRKNIL